MIAKISHTTNRLSFLIVFIAALGVYCNSLSGAFVYDDRPIIAENHLVRGRASLSKILISPYWEKAETPEKLRGGLYRPLTLWSYALTWRLGGGRPFYFHAANLLLHGLAAVLMFSLLGLLGMTAEGACLGALIFAVLPIHTEAVSWSVGRAELLGTVFVLAAWLLLHQEKHFGKIIAGLAFYTAALLSKESAAPFPAALVLGEIFRHRGSVKELLHRRLLIWLSVFGVLLLYLVWRSNILGASFSVGAPYFPTHSRLIVGLTMAKFLFRGWLWPMATGLGLCADYSRPGFPDAAMTDPWAWAALLTSSGAALAAAYQFIHKKSPAGFSVLLFLCLAAPLSNVLVPMEIIGAERIMYLPSIAFCVTLAAAWDALRRRKNIAAPWLKAVAVCCLLWWSALTVVRNRIWRDDESFYKSAATCAPDNVRVLTGLGMIADLKGRHAEARGYYQKALESDPGHTQAAYNTGKSFHAEGDWDNAKIWFQKLNNSAAHKDTLCFLGLIAEHEGLYRKALDYYARALERDPSHVEARRNLGLLLFKTGKLNESAAQLQLYLQSSPPEEDAAEISEFLKQLANPGSR